MLTLRQGIAVLSSGQYYESPETWYEQLRLTLEKHNCKLGAMPEIHTLSGDGYIPFDGEKGGVIYFTWYKMPETGHWEMVCYIA